jgi:hypothetical protein
MTETMTKIRHNQIVTIPSTMMRRRVVFSLLLLLGTETVSAFAPISTKLQQRHATTASNHRPVVENQPLFVTTTALAVIKSPLFGSNPAPPQSANVFQEAWSVIPALLASIPPLLTSTTHWQLNLLKHAISLWGMSVVVSTTREIFKVGSEIKFQDRPLYFLAASLVTGLVACGTAWAVLKTMPFWAVNLTKHAFSLWAVTLLVVSTISVQQRRQEKMNILDAEEIVLDDDEIFLDTEEILDLETEDINGSTKVQTNQTPASATPEWRDEWAKHLAEFQDEVTDFRSHLLPASFETHLTRGTAFKTKKEELREEYTLFVTTLKSDLISGVDMDKYRWRQGKITDFQMNEDHFRWRARQEQGQQESSSEGEFQDEVMDSPLDKAETKKE